MFEDFYCETCGEYAGTVEVYPATRNDPAEYATEPPSYCEECGNDTFDSEPGGDPGEDAAYDLYEDRIAAGDLD